MRNALGTKSASASPGIRRAGFLTLSFLLVAMVSTTAIAQPRIDSISPVEGPIAGGTVVTIRGANLGTAMFQVGDRLPEVESRSDTEVRLRMPAHDHGYAFLEASSTSGSAYATYLYLAPPLASLPPGSITTVGGVGVFVPYHRPANTVPLTGWGLDLGQDGSVFTASAFLNSIVRIDRDGFLRPFAGTGSYNPDLSVGDGGDARKAQLAFPRRPEIDGVGNVYVGTEDHRVRRIDAATGVITTVAGTGAPGFGGDGGPATSALLNAPSWVEAAPDGTLFILDSRNSRVRRVSPSGVISTIAGTGIPGFSGDGGPATEAQIEGDDPDAGGLAYDAAAGLLYLVQTWTDRIRKIDVDSGSITTFTATAADGQPLDHPRSVTVDGEGNVYVGASRAIYKYDRSGKLLAAWGDAAADFSFSPDGTAIADVRLSGDASGIVVEPNGDLLYTDGGTARIRRLNFARGVVETVAGIGPQAFGIPGRAVAMPLVHQEGDLEILPSGDLLFSNIGLYRIVRIDSQGMVHHFAGNGFLGGSPSPRASENGFGDVVAMQVDPAGGVYLTSGGPIQRITPDGFVEHIAGRGEGYAGDGGPAAHASFLQPWDVTLDERGNIYVADTNNNRIRRIDASTKVITSVVGANPPNGYEGWSRGSFCGDGGPAAQACLNTPFGVAVDRLGRIFIGDFYNFRVRVVEPDGTIRTFAEDLSGRLITMPSGVIIVNASWWIYRYQPDGRRFTIAGKGDRGFSGDGGPATSAMIDTFGVGGLTVDSEGNLFFVDGANRRIRAVRFGAVLAPADATLTARRDGADLDVTVVDGDHKPLAGIRVDFAAPGTGPSCSLSSSFAVTDANGQARVRCTANCVAGAYEVVVRLMGSPAVVSVNVSNPAVTCRRRAVRH